MWNHKKQQHCVGKPKSSVYEKIKAMVPVNHLDIPPMKKSTDIQPELMKQIKAEGTGLENNKADQNLIRKIALPQTIEGLLKRQFHCDSQFHCESQLHCPPNGQIG